ncbi:hypothetical protein EW146_g4181 [Bondarzewia mesenterica]|uniref:B30.2/SPRY domain-containing protein n=1 Tax=Bondarzewia mesenterica TaxID=1095465 RepID=A0A4S4LXH8_9AGAM|nr:hypothetical protein EW146_g4181 [Bondarzewia mesenterica]
MLARGSPPARDESPSSAAVLFTTSHHAPSKKRKNNFSGAVTATASPAPSDPGPSSLNPTDNVVLPSTHDLASRPRLSISRVPVFVPISEGSPYHFTEQLATNRLGFRYIPAGLTPPGSTIHVRTIESPPTTSRVSWEDRSPFIKVTPDGLGLLGDKGFRSARLNAPVREGKWYLEVTVEHGGGARTDTSKREGAYVRLGWGRREAPLNAPCGLDGYSYGLRDKTGEKVHLSRTRPYGPSFGPGDTIGMYISLPSLRQPDPDDPHDPAHIKRERIAIEFKGQEYFEYLEYPQSKEMIALMDYNRKPTDSTPLPSSTKKSATVKNVPERGGRSVKSAPEPAPLRPLPTLPTSQIAFFVNGQTPGPAFCELYDFLPLRAAPADARKARKRAREGAREHKENPFDDGCLGYYPFISLFNDARVGDERVKSEHEHEQDQGRAWRPFSERYREFMEEQWALDRLEEEQALENIAAETAEQEKRAAQRERRRAQAEARKRKKDALKQGTAERDESTPLDDGHLPSLSLPHELRILVEAHSPAPTASSVDHAGAHSAYTSEYGDGEGQVEAEEEEEEEEAPVPQTQQQQNYHYYSAASTQMQLDDS